MLLIEIQLGLLRNEFELYYQPVIDLKQNKVIGFEGLVRWHHPSLGLVSPDKFIPTIEKCGWLACAFSRYTLEKACQQASEWQCAADMTIAVNVPTAHITRASFATYFTSLLAKYGLDNSCLILELTENIYGDFPLIIKNLAVLKQNRSDILLDDFLTGFSSFEKLLMLERYLSGIKISQLFALNLIENEDIVALLTKVAHARGLSVTAEGIETEDQLAVIARLGVDTAQGWLWAPAMPAKESKLWATAYNGNAS